MAISLQLKGDHNDVVDKPITRSQVIGKIVKVFPKLGIWKKVLTDPKILFAIFITMLLFDFALSYSEKDNKKIEMMLDLDEGKPVVNPTKIELIYSSFGLKLLSMLITLWIFSIAKLTASANLLILPSKLVLLVSLFSITLTPLDLATKTTIIFLSLSSCNDISLVYSK